MGLFIHLLNMGILKAGEVGDFFVISQKKFRRICEKYLGIVHRENVDNQ